MLRRARHRGERDFARVSRAATISVDKTRAAEEAIGLSGDLPTVLLSTADECVDSCLRL